jgi:hypothetical protein
MNSKFLRICEQIRKKLNEANEDTYNPLLSNQNDNQQDLNQEIKPAEETKLSDKLESETQIVPNDQIVSLLKSFKLFLDNDKIKNFLKKEDILDEDSFNKIKMLPDTVSDNNAIQIVTTLTQIFDPTKKVDTNVIETPKEIPDSRF